MTSELVAAHLPRSQLVKVFNAIPAADIVDPGWRADRAGRRASPIARDDAAAKALVTGLLDAFGFDTVDVGLLSEGWRFEKDTPAYCVPLDAAQLRLALAAAEKGGARLA